MNTELELRLAHIENRLTDLTEMFNKVFTKEIESGKNLSKDSPEDLKVIVSDDILDNFDFQKVSNVMASLDWKWAKVGGRNETGVPTALDIKNQARAMLLDAWFKLDEEPFDENDAREFTISTGGLEVFVQEWRDENDETRFSGSLKFILEEATTDA